MTNNAILEAWMDVLAARSGHSAVFSGGGEVLRTFADVDSAARDWETRLSDIAPNAVIAIQIGNHADWPSLLLACWRRGIVVLPMERSLGQAERDAALDVCGATALLELSRNAIELRRPASRRNDWGDAPPVLLKLTSGTTATPRAVRFRAHQLAADCANICDTKGLTGADLNFAVIPVSHSYGFSNLLTPLLCRGIPLVMTADRMPRAVLDGLAATQATVFPGTPVFFQALAELPDARELPALRLCISAGAPLPPLVAAQFRSKYGRKIHTFYGSSECGGICYDASDSLDLPPGCVGTPMKNVRVTLVDQTGAGGSAVAVESHAVADGYHPDPEPDKLGNGRFVPGDLVARWGDGFRLVGRISDVINVAGRKLNPLEVEAHLLRCAGVRAAVVFGVESARRTEEAVACVVVERAVAAEDLQKHCLANLSAWQVPKKFWFVDEIPTNERGKINRRELASRYATLNR